MNKRKGWLNGRAPSPWQPAIKVRSYENNKDNNMIKRIAINVKGTRPGLSTVGT